MSIPHRCPVCEGRGEIGKRLAQVNSVLVSQKPLRFKCHSCLGAGVVWDNTVNFGWYPNQLYPFTSTVVATNGDHTCNNLMPQMFTDGNCQVS